MTTKPGYEFTSKTADAVFVIISTFDFIMDVIILIKWYNDGKLIFLGLGISFVILTQLAYLAMFHIIHKGRDIDSITLSIICTIPFTSCLQMINIFVFHPDSHVRKLFCCCNIKWDMFLKF